MDIRTEAGHRKSHKAQNAVLWLLAEEGSNLSKFQILESHWFSTCRTLCRLVLQRDIEHYIAHFSCSVNVE